MTTVLTLAAIAHNLDKELVASLTGPALAYDGEVWEWSPPKLNRIAYVDQKGDLWIASPTANVPSASCAGPSRYPHGQRMAG